MQKLQGLTEVKKIEVARFSLEAGKIVSRQLIITEPAKMRRLVNKIKFRTIPQNQIDDLMCSVGETRYVIRIQIINGKWYELELINDLLYQDNDLIGKIQGHLYEVLRDLTNSVATDIIDPARELMFASNNGF